MEESQEKCLLTDETVRDLSRAVFRLSYSVEAYNRTVLKGDSAPPYGPTLYTEDAYQRSLPAPPKRMSLYQRARDKKVSLPAATGWSLLGLALTEFLRLLISGQLHF